MVKEINEAQMFEYNAPTSKFATTDDTISSRDDVELYVLICCLLKV